MGHPTQKRTAVAINSRKLTRALWALLGLKVVKIWAHTSVIGVKGNGTHEKVWKMRLHKPYIYMYICTKKKQRKVGQQKIKSWNWSKKLYYILCYTVFNNNSLYHCQGEKQ